MRNSTARSTAAGWVGGPLALVRTETSMVLASGKNASPGSEWREAPG
jgi:hypothetical protein